MSVDEYQPVAALAFEREQVADQDASAPAERQGELVSRVGEVEAVGERYRKGGDGLGVAVALTGRPLRVVVGRDHRAKVRSEDRLHQPAVAERPGQLVVARHGTHFGGSQAEVRGRVENGDAALELG